MNITDMTRVANSATDESISTNMAMYFANEAISVINAEIGCELPFISDVSIDYVGLSETWIRQLLIPYISYSIKMNDSSIEEASIFYNSFSLGLERLSVHKEQAIPEDYRGSSFTTAYRIDYSNVANTYDIDTQPYVIAGYDIYQTYYTNDFVVYNDTIYVAIQQSKGKLPTNTDYWREY